MRRNLQAFRAFLSLSAVLIYGTCHAKHRTSGLNETYYRPARHFEAFRCFWGEQVERFGNAEMEIILTSFKNSSDQFQSEGSNWSSEDNRDSNFVPRPRNSKPAGIGETISEDRRYIVDIERNRFHQESFGNHSELNRENPTVQYN